MALEFKRGQRQELFDRLRCGVQNLNINDDGRAACGDIAARYYMFMSGLVDDCL